MRVQKSFQNEKPTLYLISTPIGNLEDITFRAINTLKSVDIIFAEDTRVSAKLLNHYDIKTPLDTYHEHNKEVKSEKIIKCLNEGMNVGLVSDAGMPIISDPGYYIVRELYNTDFNVVIIPGANAALSALTVSGLAPIPFMFFGFLSPKASKRKNQLRGILNNTYTTILYESPHKIMNTLKYIEEIDSTRSVVIAREITKRFEEIISGSVGDIVSKYESFKGEIVLIIKGDDSSKEDLNNLDPKKHVKYYIDLGYSQNEAIKMTAKDRNVSKNDIYQLFI